MTIRELTELRDVVVDHVVVLAPVEGRGRWTPVTRALRRCHGNVETRPTHTHGRTQIRPRLSGPTLTDPQIQILVLRAAAFLVHDTTSCSYFL